MLTVRTAVALGAALAIVSAARRSSAADAQFATVGMSMSVKLCCSPGGAVGFGPAFNYARYSGRWPVGRFDPAFGGYAWLQYYPSLDAARLGIGPQASYLFGGIEAGPSLMFGSEPTRMTASVTPFASVGFVWLGLRVNFVDPHAKDALLEFTLGAGYPFGAYRVLAERGN
jgi:hypothetical protein